MCENGMVLVVGNVSLSALPGDIPVISAEKVSVVDFPECAVIIGEGAEIPQVKRAAGVMINGDSGGSFPAERLSNVQLITCGRGGKNTVSITSDSGETLTLALNRAVNSLNGCVEPMEQPMKRTSAPEYDCMAAFAAAILIGKV